MSNNPKKGHSIGLGKVIGITIVALLIGILVGGILSLTVVAPQLEKIGINLPGLNTNDQSNNNNSGNNSPGYSTNDQNNNYSNNNNNDNSSNNSGSGINNYNQAPSNITASYSGSGDFQITVSSNNGAYSGIMTANINCQVQQSGSNIQLSVDLTLTNVSDSLQQVMSPGQGDQIFNFAGTMSTDTQFTANAQGSTGSSDHPQTFNFNLSGTIDSNALTFTMTSQPNDQITVSTQPITLHSK